jgi:hypothetical protein
MRIDLRTPIEHNLEPVMSPAGRITSAGWRGTLSGKQGLEMIHFNYPVPSEDKNLTQDRFPGYRIVIC